jgi:hypothetical protein
MGSHKTFYLGWSSMGILLITTSCEAGITGMNHGTQPQVLFLIDRKVQK